MTAGGDPARSRLHLHSYWRSSASYRVRIALALKGLEYSQSTHDLRTGAQKERAYVELAPHGMVPTLDTGEGVLIQSPAILEWLEERYPDPRLLPATVGDRAIVRAMAALVGCDIQPLANLRVFNALRADFGATQPQLDSWTRRWVSDGFSALETLVARHGGRFCFGDAPTFADCYLVPQLYSADRFGVDLALFPRLLEAAGRARALDAFRQADPAEQPDADPMV